MIQLFTMIDVSYTHDTMTSGDLDLFSHSKYDSKNS